MRAESLTCCEEEELKNSGSLPQRFQKLPEGVVFRINALMRLLFMKEVPYMDYSKKGGEKFA